MTGKKVDHWPRVARIDEGMLASLYPEIKVNCALTKINGMPAPATFKLAVPLLKRKPFTLEFATLDDAVEMVLAPTKRWGVHAPIVAAAVKGGIQAAYLVKRFEEGKSHHKAAMSLDQSAKALDAKQRDLDEAGVFTAHLTAEMAKKDAEISNKDAELEALKQQVLALEGTINKALGNVPGTESKKI